MGPLIQFGYLQVLDVLTTLVFLAAGIQEANPLVRAALEAAGSHLEGLLIVKLPAIVFALYCRHGGRARLLRRANLFFAALVVWNLVAVLLHGASIL